MAKKSIKRKLQKETGIAVQNEKNNISLLSMFILVGLSALLFFSPFFRGLFFPPEQEKALLVALVVFILVCIEKVSWKETKVFYHPLDYFLLALPIVYIMATFNAVNYNLSINEIIKNVLYFLVYWIVVQSIRGERDRSLLLHVIYFAALGAALAGLSTGIGIIDIKDGIALAPKVWISSSFQYHNALAGYLGAAIFLGLYFWNKARPGNDGLMMSGKTLAFLPDWLVRLNPQQLLYTKFNFLILTVFFGAKSRGGVLFFAAVFLLYLIALGRDRVVVTVYMLLMSAPAYLVAEKFLSCIAVQQMSSAVLWVIAGLVLALAGQILFILYGKYLNKLGLTEEKNQKYFFGIIALAVVAAGLLLTHYSNVERVLSFSYLRNALERMYFVDDALKMIKQRPLLGWGGGGWEEAYRSFQEYLYNSTQVHSYYVQVAVETGILGILTLLGIIGCFFMLIFNLYRDNKENDSKLQAIFTFAAMALFIAGHAMMDFNLSLSSLTMLLWTLFGLLVGMWRLSPKQVKAVGEKTTLNISSARGYLCIAGIIAVILFAADSSLILSGKYSQSAAESLSQKDVVNGLPYLEQAAKRNPFNPNYNLTLAQIYSGSGQKDKGLNEVKKALGLSKYNPSIYIESSKIYYGLEDTETAVKLAEKAVELAPYKIDGYDNLVNLYFTVGYNGLIKQKKDVATDFFNRIIGVSTNIQTRVDGLTDYQRKMWKDGPMLALTTNMASKTGAARYFLGQYKEAEGNLNFAATDEKLKAEVPLWRALVAQKMGDPEKAQAILQAGEKDNEKIRQQFAGISTLSLK